MLLFREAAILFCVLFISTANASTKTIVPQNVSSCNGAFDLYFVLDGSSSLLKDGRNNFKDETVSFVKQLADKFTNPFLRLSFITFNDEAKVVMPLTNNRQTVREKLIDLRLIIPDGNTQLHLGLGNATEQIRSHGQKRASVVIVLTDGILQYKDKQQSVQKANIARSLGATVMAVGIANFNSKQLLEIVGRQNQLLFRTDSFDGLKKIVNWVVDESCVEITSAFPGTICSNSSFELTIQGRGFHKTGSYFGVKCNYKVDEKKTSLVSPSSFSSTRLTCPSPNDVIFSPDDVILIQISLNDGVSFISSSLTIETVSCDSTDTVGLLIIFVLGFIFLFLVWWFRNAMCGVSELNETLPPKTPNRSIPPIPPVSISSPTITVTDVQQWPTVDASYYGGRGAGGINPMKVHWGERGCTEAGIYLEKAKDAKEIGFVSKEIVLQRQRKAPPPRPSPPSTSCCGGLSRLGIVRGILAPYNFLAKRRPSAGDVRACSFVKSSTKQRQVRSSDSSLTGGYLDTRQ